MPDSPTPLNVGTILDQVGIFDHQIIARVNDHDVKVGNCEGEFPAHRHDNTDEFFMVLAGTFELQLDDRLITLREGDTFTVPRGVTHAPRAEPGTRIMMVELSGTYSTGDAQTGTTGTPRF